MSKGITYCSDAPITVDDFIGVLKRSTLDERRPVHDRERMQKMLDHANVIITAWSDHQLIGVSRALTDFSFCCYLSDLAVDTDFQHRGIGNELLRRTQEAAGEQAMLILMAAPKAINYYPKIGMKNFPHCFVLDRKK
jgi:N-acetylglutamate synthase-like GNAT family acetyltransferase